VSTVILNVDVSPLVKVIVLLDTEAVTSNEPVSVAIPPPFIAYDAVNAYDADVTVAFIILPEYSNEPDIVTDPLSSTPLSLRYNPLALPLPSVTPLKAFVIKPLSSVFSSDW
jgi:hypothetical protein